MRPFGVTALAIVLLAIGSLAVVTGAILLSTKEESYPVFVEEYEKLLNQSLGDMPISEEDLKSIYEMSAYMAASFGIVYLIAGFGLLTLREWGRILTILIAGFNVVYSIFLLFIQPVIAVEIAVNLVIIWYLMKPEVREKFLQKN